MKDSKVDFVIIYEQLKGIQDELGEMKDLINTINSTKAEQIVEDYTKSKKIGRLVDEFLKN